MDSKIVGITFKENLVGSFLAKNGDTIVLKHEPLTLPNGKSYPNCVNVYSKIGIKIGSLPEPAGSVSIDPQTYALELLKENKEVEGKITGVLFRSVPKETIPYFQEIHEKRNKTTDATLDKIQSAIQGYTGEDCAQREYKEDYITRPSSLQISFGDKNVDTKPVQEMVSEDGHINYEADPETGVLCQSITHFLSSVEHLYLSPQEIKGHQSYRNSIGELGYKLLMHSTATEGTEMHHQLHTALWVWSKLPKTTRNKLRKEMEGWEDVTQLAKLLLNEDFNELVIEEVDRMKNTVFLPQLKIKATNDFYYIEDDCLVVCDNKRSTVKNSKGVKNHIKYELQIAGQTAGLFQKLNKERPKDKQLKGVKARIFHWQLQLEDKAELHIVELDDVKLRQRYNELVLLTEGKTIY